MNISKKKLNVLITGGAGFIGRWVVSAFLNDTNHNLLVLDDFSNSSPRNLEEFRTESRLKDVIKDSVENRKLLAQIFAKFKPAICVHLAAQINVQDSIDKPEKTFNSDILGAFRLLEECRRLYTRMVFMSTCMVYDLTAVGKKITESHPTTPRSPYAAAKLAGEHLSISYYHAYRLPVTIMRPFNTYGPFQKHTGEGGVISIFLHRQLRGEDLLIFGSGRQTRDFLYVEDCADFILRCSVMQKAVGHTFNAATGKDITINELAKLIIASAETESASRIRRIKHIHPQSEIMKLQGSYNKAKEILGWKPTTSLAQGIKKTRNWLNKI
ncbi:MAG: GDP-mannose 4,6-dehydratase [bacterium]